MARDSTRAAVLTGPGAIELENVELRPLGPDDVRVALEGCGVCASNLPVWEGRPWFHYPLPAGAPGHEGWGRVVAVGTNVNDYEAGERVALVSGQAYADCDTAGRNALVKLPAALDDRPFPGEPIGCAMNVFERSDVKAGHTVAIVGAGFLGLLLTQLAATRGATTVVLSRREWALECARAAGAHQTIATSAPSDALQRALEIAPHGYDRVIEVVGDQASLDLASALTCEGGRLVIAGYHQDGKREVNLQQWNWRGLDVVNAHERSIARYVAGIEAAVAAVVDGTIDPYSLLTHRFTLDELGRGMEAMRARPNGFIKGWVELGGGA